MNETEERAQKKSKVWYDKKAKELSYKKSEQVLLLLPLIGKSLQAKYRGPYVIVKRLGEADYVVRTQDP